MPGGRPAQSYRSCTRTCRPASVCILFYLDYSTMNVALYSPGRSMGQHNPTRPADQRWMPSSLIGRQPPAHQLTSIHTYTHVRTYVRICNAGIGVYGRAYWLTFLAALRSATTVDADQIPPVFGPGPWLAQRFRSIDHHRVSTSVGHTFSHAFATVLRKRSRRSKTTAVLRPRRSTFSPFILSTRVGRPI